MAKIVHYECERCDSTFKAEYENHIMGDIVMAVQGHRMNLISERASCICMSCQEKFGKVALEAFNVFFNK